MHFRPGSSCLYKASAASLLIPDVALALCVFDGMALTENEVVQADVVKKAHQVEPTFIPTQDACLSEEVVEDLSVPVCFSGHTRCHW